MIRALTFSRGEKDMRKCIWADQTEAGVKCVFLGTFVWFTVLYVPGHTHTHTKCIVSKGPSHDQRAVVSLLAGALLQPQLDLSSAVKGPFKMMLLYPCFPTSCGLLKLSLISQFSNLTVLLLQFARCDWNESHLLYRSIITWNLKKSGLKLNLLTFHAPPTCVAVSLVVLVASRWHCSQVVTVCSPQFHLPAPAAKGKSANVFVSS